MNKLIICIMSAMLLFLSGCTQTLPTSQTSSSPLTEKHQIGESWHYGQQAISEDIMVALEYVQDEHYNMTGTYLSTYNLVTQEKRRIIEVPQGRIFTEPSIYGDKVVCSSLNRSEVEQQPPPRNYDILNWDVFLFDLTTGEMRQITTETHAQVHPRIYENTIVWLDNRHEATDQYPHPYDVYAFDLKTNQEKRITSATTAEGYGTVSISGNAVIWTDMRHANPQIKNYPSNAGDYNNEIYLFDLVTNQEHRITSNSANDHYPCIDGTMIVWLRQIGYRQANVYAYDLAPSIGKEIQISQSNYAADFPSISGNLILWQDARSSQGNTSNDVIMNGQAGASDIYLFDLQTMTEIKLTSEDEDGNRLWASPVIHGDYALYVLDRQVGPITYELHLTGGK
jgi:Tol biopolymer transport system component